VFTHEYVASTDTDADCELVVYAEPDVALIVVPAVIYIEGFAPRFVDVLPANTMSEDEIDNINTNVVTKIERYFFFIIIILLSVCGLLHAIRLNGRCSVTDYFDYSIFSCV
jgi:hypothetical protein